MKFSSTDVFLIALALAQARAVVVPEPEHHIIRDTDTALDERQIEEAQFHPIAENELGTVYSNVAPHQRRDNEDVTYYPVAENEYGTVYSNVAPIIEKRSGPGDVSGERDVQPRDGLEKRSDDYKDVGIERIHEFMEEHGVEGKEKRENDAPLEKRDWAYCIVCMAACQYLQTGINLLSTAQQVQFCLGNCVAQGACTAWNRVRYERDYGESFPAQGPG